MVDRKRPGRWPKSIRPRPQAEVDEELTFHIEQRVRDYIARGLDPQAARAAAEARLGDLRRVRGECTELLTAERREESRRRWLEVSWLDVKLGFRLLARYPGFTIVGGLAMAFAIWVGAGTFEFIRQVVFPVLPLDGGARIVGLRLWHTASQSVEEQALFDFELWRGDLGGIQDLGAFRSVSRNLITADGSAVPVTASEMTASGFRVAGVPPLLGRWLAASDERADAPRVALIGYDVWVDRFDASPTVLGQTVRLGTTPTTIVGVMPEGFAFPVEHNVWTPLRLDELSYGPRAGPAVRLFGRLAPDISLRDAEAELTALGQRTSEAFPETHEHIRPQVMSYPKLFLGLDPVERTLFLSMNLFVAMLVVLIGGNVALLMFARAATRESELVVRSALGASRGRIITQLFAEALVLALLATMLGLAATRFGLRWGLAALEAEAGGLPFWITDRLSPATLFYSLLLAFLCAVIAGVVPARKVTRGLRARLTESTAGGGGIRFGGVWTAVIVAQVAVTVAFPVTAHLVRRDMQIIQSTEVFFPAQEFLAARIEMDRGETGTTEEEFRARFAAAFDELQRRVSEEATVAEITYADLLPRTYHPARLVEVDEGGAAPLHPQWPDYRVSSANVDPAFFDILTTRLLSGRQLHTGDMETGARAVVVNQSFVDLVLGGRNAIGRRVRYTHFEEWEEPRQADAPPLPWHEIVGVVADMNTTEGHHDPKRARIYHAAAPVQAYPVSLAIHTRGDPESFGPRLRALAVDVDPALRVYDPTPMDELNRADLAFLRFWFRLVLAVSAVALLLSLSGIYSVMAFTVSRRTREIGIRVALGSGRRRVVLAILRRPLLQVAAGLLFGLLLSSVLLGLATSERGVSLKIVAQLATYGVAMLGVCMLACIVPARHALRIQPSEAMRAEG